MAAVAGLDEGADRQFARAGGEAPRDAGHQRHAIDRDVRARFVARMPARDRAEEAEAAITALNGSQLGGRSLTVNEAKPMEPRSGGGRSGGGGRFGGNPGCRKLLWHC